MLKEFKEALEKTLNRRVSIEIHVKTIRHENEARRDEVAIKLLELISEVVPDVKIERCRQDGFEWFVIESKSGSCLSDRAIII